MLDKNLLKTFSKIKLLAMDFDGVMTDGLVYVDDDGRERVRCSRRDGMGIGLLKKAGVEICVISTEKNPVVSRRCEKLKIPCVQGIESGDGKGEIFQRFMKEGGYNREESAYVGDDVNDLAPLKLAGCAITVADGHELVKNVCHYISDRKGGDHAVREICELILKAKNIEISY